MTFNPKLAVQYRQIIHRIVIGTVTKTGNQLSNNNYHVITLEEPEFCPFIHPSNPRAFNPICCYKFDFSRAHESTLPMQNCICRASVYSHFPSLGLPHLFCQLNLVRSWWNLSNLLPIFDKICFAFTPL